MINFLGEQGFEGLPFDVGRNNDYGFERHVRFNQLRVIAIKRLILNGPVLQAHSKKIYERMCYGV